MSLFVGSLIVLAITTIITESYLFRPVRSLATRISGHLGVLLGCFLCMGTWVGVGLGLLVDGVNLRGALLGLAYQGLAYLLHVGVALADDLRVRLQR